MTIYAIFAVACTAFWWRGLTPFPFLGGDAADIASWAAAWSDPDRFIGDAVLGDRHSYAIYAVLHIPLLIGLKSIFGDYGTAFLALLPLAICVQAHGTYMLGRRLLRERAPAIVFGATAFAFTWIGPGDYYGFYHDAQPRLLFQAVLPFLLILQLQWAEQPERWPWLLAAHGAAMYIHPVSAPAVAFASWLALPVLVSRNCDRRRVIVGLAHAAVVFLIVAGPFVFNYLAHRDTSGREIALHAFGTDFASVGNYLRAAITEWRLTLFALPIGALGATLVWKLARECRLLLMFFLVWLAGILAVAIGMTFLDQYVARLLSRQPIQIDLVRNLRFVLPVLTWLGFWGVFLALQRHRTRLATAGLVLVAAGWLVINKPGSIPVRATASCFVSGHMFCPPREWIEDRQALEALQKRLARGTPVLAALDDARGRAFSVAIRYFALLPVVFSFQDGGSAMAYSDHAAAGEWLRTASELKKVLGSPDGPEKTRAMLTIAERLGARAVVAQFPIDPEHIPAEWHILDQIGDYTIIAGKMAKSKSPAPAAQ